MATRLHRIGTIFSRVDGAFRKGLIKEDNLPIWFNLYKRFPPKYEPKYTTDVPQIKIQEILYKEDVLRAEIHKICSNKQEAINLMNEAEETQSQKLLKTCQQYISEGMTQEDALKKNDEVTSKHIRGRLEEDLDMDLGEFKPFIDEEMLTILGQMDAATEIFDHVYLGSEWIASNHEELQKNGIRHILNVTREIDNFFPGMFNYLTRGP